MITTQLLRPESIVVVGASNNVHKPGGAILKNLINGGYRGELRAVNPKEKEVQGVPAFADVNDLPDTDLAVLSGTRYRQLAEGDWNAFAGAFFQEWQVSVHVKELSIQ